MPIEQIEVANKAENRCLIDNVCMEIQEKPENVTMMLLCSKIIRPLTDDVPI